MPDPTPNESHDEFIDRCMSDSEARRDFPETDQRLAFCESQWDKTQNLLKETINRLEKDGFVMDSINRINNLIASRHVCYKVTAKGHEPFNTQRAHHYANLAAADDTVRVFGEIGWDVTADDFTAAMAAVQGDVNVQVSSDGGEIYNGLEMYATINNRVRGGDAVNVEIMAKAFSAASFFPMAASRIRMHASAEMMIHNAWTLAFGNKDELGEVSQRLSEIDAVLVDIYAARTGQTPATIAGLMDAETFMRAEVAQEHGFVDEVIPLVAGDRKKHNNGRSGMGCPIINGRRLGARLNSAIEDMVDDDTTRSDIISQMARAANISEGTVNEIIAGEINCPPRQRLSAFAGVLDVSTASLISAAESDGCTYESENKKVEKRKRLAAALDAQIRALK